MLEQLIERILPTIIAALELMGIFIVAVSALSAFGRYLKSLFTRTPCDVKFALANGLALSLEFKMAAEILKTVLVRDLRASGAGRRHSAAGPALLPDPL